MPAACRVRRRRCSISSRSRGSIVACIHIHHYAHCLMYFMCLIHTHKGGAQHVQIADAGQPSDQVTVQHKCLPGLQVAYPAASFAVLLATLPVQGQPCTSLLLTAHMHAYPSMPSGAPYKTPSTTADWQVRSIATCVWSAMSLPPPTHKHSALDMSCGIQQGKPLHFGPTLRCKSHQTVCVANPPHPAYHIQ
jgi:hypothetical protein